MRLAIFALCVAVAFAAGPGSQLWAHAYHYGSNTAVAPLIVGTRVLAVDINNTVHCFDLMTGHQYWVSDLPAGFTPNSLLLGITTFGVMGSSPVSTFAVFDLSHGHFLWSYAPYLNTVPVAFDDKYLLPSTADTAIVFERSGFLIGRLPTVSSVVAAYNSMILVATPSGGLSAYSSSTYQLLWQQGANNTFNPDTNIYTSGTYLIVSNSGDNTVTSVCPSNGNVLWSYSTYGGPVALYGDVVVVFSSMGVTALDASSGSQLWTVNSINGSTSISSFIAASGVVVASASMSDGHTGFALLDISNGNLNAFEVIPTQTASVQFYASRGQLLVPNLEGVVAVALTTGATTFDTMIDGLVMQAVGGGVFVGVNEFGVVAIQV